MKQTLLVCMLAFCACTSDGPDRELAMAEAQARTAEAEARAAEAEAQARAAEAEAQTRTAEARAVEAEAQTAPAPAPAPVAAPRPPAEPTVDYEPFGRPQTAIVQTQSDGRITLRDAPRANARRVVRVVDGTRLSVLGCQSDATVRTDAAASGTPGRWCYVRTGSQRGWAFDAYLVF